MDSKHLLLARIFLTPGTAPCIMSAREFKKMGFLPGTWQPRLWNYELCWECKRLRQRSEPSYGLVVPFCGHCIGWASRAQDNNWALNGTACHASALRNLSPYDVEQFEKALGVIYAETLKLQ